MKQSKSGQRWWHVLAQRALVLMAVVVCLWWAWELYQRSWYTDILPAQVGVDGVLVMHMDAGLMEACGAVVFRLDEQTSQALMQQGKAYLRRATRPRSVERHPRLTFPVWQPTPYEMTGEGMGLEDRWMVGLSCAAMPEALSRDIDEALSTPGAYFAHTPEGLVLVAPRQQLVVFANVG